MSQDARARTDAALGQMQAAYALADGRDAYREQLRALRARPDDAFRLATAHYESEVVPRLGSAGEAIEAWIEYGRVLGEAGGPGRLHAIDPSGRASAYQPPYAAGTLVLYVPDEKNDSVLPVAVPVLPSPAQRATLALLVDRQLSLP
jgi:hypothetical protein